jgi:hypothetical protein
MLQQIEQDLINNSWKSATFSPFQFSHSRCSYSQQSEIVVQTPATPNTSPNHAISQSDIHNR